MPNINVNLSFLAPLVTVVNTHFCNFASDVRNFSEVTAILSSLKSSPW